MSLFSLGYSVRRRFVDQFYFNHIPCLATGSRVLDLGGHRLRKRGRFNLEKYNLSVICLNLTSIKRPDIQADGIAVPIKTGEFDAVICAELLEHVPDPVAVLREGYRTLRANGKILITVPFLFPIHGDPYDYGRYTDHFWYSTLKEIGFQNISIEKQGLYFSVMVNFLKLYVNRRCRPPVRQLVSWPLALLQWLALEREQYRRVQTDPFQSSFTTGFGIVAHK